MKKYCEMSREELLDLKKELDREFAEIKAEGLALDMSRGKPAPDQLDLSMKMMEVLAGDADLKCETGVDCRNYGVLDGIKEAKEILKAQGASYKNLTFDSDSTVGKYAGNIMAFPTTVLVDKDGNIVGEPFMGGIDDQSNYDQLMKQIQSVLDQN